MSSRWAAGAGGSPSLSSTSLIPAGQAASSTSAAAPAASRALANRPATVRIVGLDASDAYVAHARRRCGDPRVEFRQGDACAIPFPNASFDGVLSLLMLPFVPQAEAVVAEMRRVARPGAVLGGAGDRARPAA